MTTVVEMGVKKVVDDFLRDEKFRATLYDYLEKMKAGFFGWHQEVFIQKWDGDKLDIYDAYSFACLHTMFGNGKIAVARVFLGLCPGKDREVSENNDKLKKLGEPFSGEFWGGTQDEDGVISVGCDIPFLVQNFSGQLSQKLFSGVFPLEVGYVSAGKIFMYLNSSRVCCARWPYGSEDVWLLHRVD